jgi:hypothetical protein
VFVQFKLGLSALVSAGRLTETGFAAAVFV